MSLRRSFLLLLFLLLASTRLSASGEIVLFQYPDFMGRSISLQGYTPDLENLRFNDRAESLRVESGYWEFCTDADFRGQCHRLGPGEYPELERSLNRRISSARPVEEAPPNRHRPEAQPYFQFGPNAL